MHAPKDILVYAHWKGLNAPTRMGILQVSMTRGNEVFAFEYDRAWLQSKHARELDPNLGLYTGPQYVRDEHPNFGLFLDSSPDRWGRVLMKRRSAQIARRENRKATPLLESDFLLGVYDEHRVGALRFKLQDEGPFLDANKEMAAPPWARLRDLEYASLQLEKEDAEDHKDYMQWLNMLIAPGGSLGGARPKSGVVDTNGHLWIAKFPSRQDAINSGAWEYLIYTLAIKAGINMSPAKMQRFSGKHDTFLTKRFDRTDNGERLQFASAMTLLNKKDGDNHQVGVSYLHLVDYIIQNSVQTDLDLKQLWRRIVFNVCVSNVDDHLRNHGFILQDKGWILSPAFDINPSPTGNGLTLNISEDDNAQDLDLIRSVAEVFRIKTAQRETIIDEVKNSVKKWRKEALKIGLSRHEMEEMQSAFRFSD